jgi:hypothetical protein
MTSALLEKPRPSPVLDYSKLALLTTRAIEPEPAGDERTTPSVEQQLADYYALLSAMEEEAGAARR